MNDIDNLTKKEKEAFLYIIEGMSDAEIAIAMTISLSTVKMHIHNILTKAGVRDRKQLIVYEHRGILTQRVPNSTKGENIRQNAGKRTTTEPQTRKDMSAL